MGKKSEIWDSRTRGRFEARARIMKAMAHPSRLFIIDQLAQQKRCVNELTDMIGDDISTVSKHLSILKNAGLVDDEKRGNRSYYSLKCPCILTFFSCLESVLQISAREHLEVVEFRR